MPDTTLTSAERLELIASNAVSNRPIMAISHDELDFVLSLARAGLEARKAEESMRERAAALVDESDFQSSVSHPPEPADLVALALAIRALPLTGDKP